MGTLLFVHGTGVRAPGYEKSLSQVKQGVEGMDISVAECLWGESLGVRLWGEGISIPPDLPHLATDGATTEDETVALWSILYQDPLYELRLLKMVSEAHFSSGSQTSRGFVPGQESPVDLLRERAYALNKPETYSEPLRSVLKNVGITERDLARAAHFILQSTPYQSLLPYIQEPLTPYRQAIARATVAGVFANYAEDEAQREDAPLLGVTDIPPSDGQQRDQLVTHLAAELGSAELGVRTWLEGHFIGLAKRMGINYVMRNRRLVSQEVYPGVGDILFYQGRGGQAMREFILERIKSAHPPVLLLGHSLGGIMCVDMLAQTDLSAYVALLVTVGSQSPVFYELNALTSLEWGQPLPRHFPIWLNIYDRRDFLSYVGSGVFPGRVKDEPIDSHQPFPQSHSAYWSNQRTWELIHAEWKTARTQWESLRSIVCGEAG